MIELRALTVASRDAVAYARRCTSATVVGSLDELRAVLAAAPAARGPTTLDLLGHSTRGHHFLRIGRDVIDLFEPRVAAFFDELAERRVLQRIGVVGVRLLGCQTAVGEAAAMTMRRLAHRLGVSVFGTTKPLFEHHHDAAGFREVFARVLVEARPERYGLAPETRC